MRRMSKDRVRFTIPALRISGNMRDLLHRAFNLQLPTNYRRSPEEVPEEVTIICRPSQFARFLILRNDMGGANSFKELNPKLFIPVEVQTEFDVSQNPNEVAVHRE